QGRFQRLSDKKAGAIKQAAVRALEPELHKLVAANRAEMRGRGEELHKEMVRLQASLELEGSEQV
ncbi:unnamed protein product, partial [Discosporangium mesarthrocarpum]